MLVELPKSYFYQVKSIFEKVSVSQALVLNVLNHDSAGRVWGDGLKKSRAALVLHRSGEACLGGNPLAFSYLELREKIFADNEIQTIIAPTEQWKDCLKEALGNRFVMHLEMGFSLTSSQWDDSFAQPLSNDFIIKPLDLALCQKIEKTWSGTNWFWGWGSVNDFIEKGRGYAILHKNDVVSFVSPTFPYGDFSKYVEFNIQTSPLYRKRGLATVLCIILLRYCFQNGFTATWSTEVENLPSQNLARKLGFQNAQRSYWFEKNN